MRKIIHIDMDAFFAAVEQRDFPELKGKPVIVGGNPDSRGVVATCSYEARRYGIHSAMPSSRAYKLCPQGVFVYPRFDAYKEASRQIHEIFNEYTDLIEPLSLDEAYLDVSGSGICNGSATLIAENIRQKIANEVRLTASAGISYNKFLAKLASDQNKPNGQFVIKPGEAESFLAGLPIGRFYGVGKVTEAKLQSLKIYTGADLQNKSLLELQHMFGQSAEYYYDICRGIDHRPVSNVRIRKSMGSETTFEEDLHDKHQMLDQLYQLLDEVLESLKQKELIAYTLTVKIKYADFTQVTRSYTDENMLSDGTKLRMLVEHLLDKSEVDTRPVRLLGVSFSNLMSATDQPEYTQLELF